MEILSQYKILKEIEWQKKAVTWAINTNNYEDNTDDAKNMLKDIDSFLFGTSILKDSKHFAIPYPEEVPDINLIMNFEKMEIKPLDLPFSKMIISIYGKNEIWVNEDPFEPKLNEKACVNSIFIDEQSFGIYKILYRTVFERNKNRAVWNCKEINILEQNKFETTNETMCYCFIAYLCEVLKNIKNTRHLITVQNKFKCNIQGKRHDNYTSDVIFIKMNPEDEPETYFPNCKTHAKCPYQYEVRGHWRKLDGFNKVGKNRDNEYIVEGYTWVSEHIRGDEDGILIKKQRVLINN